MDWENLGQTLGWASSMVLRHHPPAEKSGDFVAFCRQETLNWSWKVGRKLQLFFCPHGERMQRLLCIYCALDNNATPPFLLAFVPPALKAIWWPIFYTNLCFASIPTAISAFWLTTLTNANAYLPLVGYFTVFKKLSIVSFKFYNNSVGLTRRGAIKAIFYMEQNQPGRSLGAGLLFSTTQWECFYASVHHL